MSKSTYGTERDPKEVPKRLPPARTRDRRMQQLGKLAEDLLEERVRQGIASPTETVALLKVNSPEAIANLARIRAQTEYLEAQRKKAESETFREDMMEKAMAAMSRYKGQDNVTFDV